MEYIPVDKSGDLCRQKVMFVREWKKRMVNMDLNIGRLIQEQIEIFQELPSVTFTSKAGQMFQGHIGTARMSYIFSVVGSKGFIQTFPNDKSTGFIMMFTLRALMNLCVTFLERFYIEFIIEKLSNDSIKTKDDLKAYIHRNGYSYKGKQERLISFQGFNEVKHYFKMLLEIDLDQCDVIKDIKLLMAFRNIDVHNYGLFDNDFREKNSQFLNGDEKAVGHFTTGLSYMFNTQNLLLFVKYIDNH